MKTIPKISFFISLVVIAVFIGAMSLTFGRFPISLAEIGQLFLPFCHIENANTEQIHTVIFNIRLPRIIAAFLVGGTLSITGAAYQGMFRNPMVSPSILGVSAGAGFGAALAILLGLNAVMLQGLSFIFGIVAVFTVYAISLVTGKKHDRCLTLILAGMIVATVFTALLSVLKYIADPDNALPTIVYWLMGGLSDIEVNDLYFIATISVVGLVVLSISGWKLDLLSFGDEEAKTMGIRVERLRITVIAVATLMTAAAVSISGIIGWVGLVIPHISRMLIGPKNAELLPAAFLIGGIFLLIVDGFSRTITSMEIPLGITTSLIGAPFFLFILMKTSKKH
jgi:iron complex transport system permease protein